MSADYRRKVGLFGGTFDPVHKAHVALAEYVLGQVALDSIFFIPAAHPPHKSHIAASYHHRVAMLELALKHNSALHVSLIESEYDGPSYTIHTLRQLQQQNDEQYVLIIGADSLVDLPNWYHAGELIDSVDFIVVSRQGVDHDTMGETLRLLDVSYTCDDQELYRLGNGRFIHYLDGFHLPVSSSSLRDQLRTDTGVPMLNQQVLFYIRKHNLYHPRAT
ncbi:MAG: nicotinate (nicotinamide) nucleotide adenylyltransferase [Desulfobulbus propionicus]|nr:MAG: nicotinate (nicotinamide) nucleotide adenylyltransferase [Desulfobulbus propionicus]